MLTLSEILQLRNLFTAKVVMFPLLTIHATNCVWSGILIRYSQLHQMFSMLSLLEGLLEITSVIIMAFLIQKNSSGTKPRN